MGMCRVNGPEALPVKPAGKENLGKATNNICEAYALYGGAHPSDYGQRLPTKQVHKDYDSKNQVRIGQNTSLDLDMLYYVRHANGKPKDSQRVLEARRRRTFSRGKVYEV